MSRRAKATGFVALTIAMFMGMLDSTIVNIALPDITNYFHSALKDTSWISTVYVMGIAVLSITSSKLGDQFGRKKLMLVGIALFGASSAMCGLSHSLESLIMFRLLQSVGGSIVTPLVIPMGIELFGKEKLQPVAGAVGAISALAAAGGPPIGGLLIKYLSWQAIFFVNVPFAVISFTLIALFVGESYDKTVSKSIDWLGMLFLTSSLFLLTFALLKGNDYGWGSPLIVSMFVGSVLSTAFFILTESKVKAPMVELHLFKETTFTMSTVCNLITGFGISCPILIFSYFLQDALGYDALKAALIIMAVSLTVVVMMPLGTAVASKFGARPVNFLGVLMLAAGVFWLSTVKVTTSKPVMVAMMIVCGVGLGFAVQAMISAVKYLPTEKSGIGSGVVNAARQIGICLGIAILVSFLDTNVTGATESIKSSAIASVQGSSIVAPVKTVMVDDIKKDIDTSGDTSSLDQSSLESNLKTDIQNKISTVSSVPRPTDGTLGKLYDASSSLAGGASKAADGQKSLGKGLSSLNLGLGGLYGGSRSLTSGAWKLDGGVKQVSSGAGKLSSGLTQLGKLKSGASSLSNGASQVSKGLDALSAQFKKTSDGSTLKDKIDELDGGAKSLSSGAASLSSGAKQVSDGTSSLMAQLGGGDGTLGGDVSKLDGGAKSYVGTSGAVMSALRGNDAVFSGICGSLTSALKSAPGDTSAISNLATALILTTDTGNASELQQATALLSAAGIKADKDSIASEQASYDGGGTALTSGADSLAAQMKQGTSSAPTLYDEVSALNSGAQTVAGGAKSLSSGASSLAGGTDALDAQTAPGKGEMTLYDDVSALDSGAGKVASGADELTAGTSKLGELQSGFTSLVSALDELENGTQSLSAGAQNLESGLNSAAAGGKNLSSGSAKLLDASEKLAGGSAKLKNGVALSGQQAKIDNVVNGIKSDKNTKVAGAFDRTFLLAAIILVLTSVFGLFTDKKPRDIE